MCRYAFLEKSFATAGSANATALSHTPTQQQGWGNYHELSCVVYPYLLTFVSFLCRYAFLEKSFATAGSANAAAGAGAAAAAAGGANVDGSLSVLTGLAILHAITRRQPTFLLRNLKQVSLQ